MQGLRGASFRLDADGTHALDGLELRIPAGSFFGLLGPNGAGKSTLIGSVAGLVRAPAGRIFVFGLASRSRRSNCSSIAAIADSIEVSIASWMRSSAASAS